MLQSKPLVGTETPLEFTKRLVVFLKQSRGTISDSYHVLYGLVYKNTPALGVDCLLTPLYYPTHFLRHCPALKTLATHLPYSSLRSCFSTSSLLPISQQQKSEGQSLALPF